MFIRFKMEIDRDFHDKITHLCLEQFKTLPKSGKPNQNEWTILSCVVLELNNKFEVVALGTGSKCIGKSKLSNSGDILNDSHAEVICRRSFLRFLYCQKKDITESSILCFNKTSKKYCQKEGVKFHFFTTHVPCGDAAIFPKENPEDFGDLIKESDNEAIFDVDYQVPVKKIKTEEKCDIFRTGAKCLTDCESQDLKLSGSAYHVLGAVRTKPGRGDPTLSVSCSDKLSRWCHLGVQGALLSILLEKPIYFSSFTIAANVPFCKMALERALYGRLGNVKLNPPYFQNKLSIGQSALYKFEYSKDSGKRPCASSISWCNIKDKRVEVAVEGKRQGVTKKKINTPVGRLNICKLQLFKSFKEICNLIHLAQIQSCDIKTICYRDAKMLAVDYKNSWNVLRKSFKIWTNKNVQLLDFSE